MGENGTGTRVSFFFPPERISTCEKKYITKMPTPSYRKHWYITGGQEDFFFFFCKGREENHAVLCEDRSVLL